MFRRKQSTALFERQQANDAVSRELITSGSASDVQSNPLRPENQSPGAVNRRNNTAREFELDDIVRHDQFGIGQIIGVKKTIAGQKVIIRFKSNPKKLYSFLSRLAPLRKV